MPSRTSCSHSGIAALSCLTFSRSRVVSSTALKLFDAGSRRTSRLKPSYGSFAPAATLSMSA